MSNHYHNHNSYNSVGNSSGSNQLYTNGDGKHDYNHHQGVVRLTNGYAMKPLDNVAVPDMCLFCFEVLDCELNNMEGPGTPPFTNDA
ncbi:hypothetical protein FF38_12859 [Lucilia cuprina]|uniref:Uncharacterized protein n=2 Tax=Lucilia cuprina TaxID=7375 RepID=A0A0L0BV13_LUCCU|nr:hypothetical protein FF38_12859 [Lucilia cuprina]